MEQLNHWALTVLQGKLTADELVWLLAVLLLIMIVGALVALIGDRSD
jgi:hypothetical protein